MTIWKRKYITKKLAEGIRRYAEIFQLRGTTTTWTFLEMTEEWKESKWQFATERALQQPHLLAPTQ